MILNISFSLFFICKIIRATFYCDGDALEGDVANVATNVECRQTASSLPFQVVAVVVVADTHCNYDCMR